MEWDHREYPRWRSYPERAVLQSNETLELRSGIYPIHSIRPDDLQCGRCRLPPKPKSSKLPGKIYFQKQAGKSRAPLSCQEITFNGRTISCSGNVAGKPDLVQKQEVVQILIGPQ